MDKKNQSKRLRTVANNQSFVLSAGHEIALRLCSAAARIAEGEQNYNNDLIQSISYNENNDPVYIDGERGDARFEYGLTNMRQVASYGGNFDPDSDGKFTKYYSEDGSYEVIRNNQTGQEKHLIYIGGRHAV